MKKTKPLYEGKAKILWETDSPAYMVQEFKNDVSLTVSKAQNLIRKADAAAEDLVPGIRPYAYGHMGDGNVHYNLTQPEAMSAEDFMARQPEIQRRMHDIAMSLGGSISAEHGVGLTKRAEVARVKPAIELELMRRLKSALDPEGLMNPGKIFTSDEG